MIQARASLETKRLIQQLSDSIDCDIVDKIENFTSVKDLLKHVCDNKLNIFMPDKYFNTVFHILLLDFKTLADFIKLNKETYNYEYEVLKHKIYTNIANCDFDIGPDQAASYRFIY